MIVNSGWLFSFFVAHNFLLHINELCFYRFDDAANWI